MIPQGRPPAGCTWVAVYDVSRCLSVIEGAPRKAWDAAVATVRSAAHAAGESGPGAWFRTANRCGYRVGQFRALPVLAEGVQS